MKKHFTRIPITLLLYLCFFATAGFSQSGSVAGKVVDEQSLAVSYATVQLKGTTYGANTDDDGMYEIVGVPPGTYTLAISYVGYAEYTQSVTVGAGVVNLNCLLY